MNLCRNWLTTNLLPSDCWYFAIRYAVQVLNYIPFLKNNIWTTAFECLYNKKPDYRKLLPIFSIGYVKRFKCGVDHRTKAMSQSVKCILVGNDNKSDGQLLYVPHTKSLI